jgi:hypothetical protein
MPVKLVWSGGDAFSGVDHYEVRQSTDGAAWAPIATPTSPTLSPALSPRHEYRFAVRAVDRAGNRSAWAYGTTFSLTPYHETSFSYQGDWSTVWTWAYWAQSANISYRAGASATLTFTGRSVALVSYGGPTRGKATIRVNGKDVATIDMYNPTDLKQRVVWSANWTTSTQRTVVVEVQGTAGHPRVDIDGAFVGS